MDSSFEICCRVNFQHKLTWMGRFDSDDYIYGWQCICAYGKSIIRWSDEYILKINNPQSDDYMLVAMPLFKIKILIWRFYIWVAMYLAMHLLRPKINNPSSDDYKLKINNPRSDDYMLVAMRLLLLKINNPWSEKDLYIQHLARCHIIRFLFKV